MKTIKELVTLLQTISDTIPLPDVATDDDGDLKLEWYFNRHNLVLLTIPTDGNKPYITKFIKREGGTEWDLNELPELIESAKEWSKEYNPELET